MYKVSKNTPVKQILGNLFNFCFLVCLRVCVLVCVLSNCVVFIS